MSEGKGQDRPRGLTRRELLGKAAKAGLGIVAGTVGVGPLVAGLGSREKQKTTSLPGEVKNPGAQSARPFLDSPAVSELQGGEVDLTMKSAVQRPMDLDEEVDVEEQELRKRTEEQLGFFRREPGYEHSINEVKEWMKLVREAAVDLRKVGLNISEEAVSWLGPMIYVESRGKKQALNVKTKATGLCQILPWVAKGIVDKLDRVKIRRLGLKAEPLDLFDPETNTMLGLLHIDRLLEVFPETTLAIWTYHLGEKNMVLAIEEYLRNNIGVQSGIVAAALKKRDLPGTMELVNKYKINFIRLIDSKNVVGVLKSKDAFGNDTHLYVPRVFAARRLLES